MMCLPPPETYRAGASWATFPAVCRDGINWLWLSSTQGGESALLGEGTREDKQDSVSLPSQVLFPSSQDPVLVNLHFESNAFCVLLDASCSERPAWHISTWELNSIPEQIALTRIGKDADLYFLVFLGTLF